MNNSSSSEEQTNTKQSKHSANNHKKENNFTDDNAMEIVDIEFRDLEDWIKKETRKLKKDSFGIIDCLKVKQNLGHNLSSLDDD